MGINFEDELGKSIDDISFIGEVKNNSVDKNILLISEPKVLYLGNPIDQILININENRLIERFFIVLPEPIDKSFYKTISEVYGHDYDVMVLDKVISEKSSIKKEGDFKEYLNRKEMLLKKGNINDQNIYSIVWNKKKFKLIMIYNYFKNRIDIHYIINN